MTAFSGWLAGKVNRVRNWLAGRKTYFLMAIVILTVLFLLFFGRMTPQHAWAVFLFMCSGSAVTFRSALGRHQAEELAILQKIADAGASFQVHNYGATQTDVVAAVLQALTLTGEVKAEDSAPVKEGVANCS